MRCPPADPDGTDVLRVDLEAGGVFSEPRHGTLGILDVERKSWAPCGDLSVVDGHAHAASCCHRGSGVDFAGRSLVTARSASAVDDDIPRMFFPGLQFDWKIEVGFFSLVVTEKVHVLFDPDLRRAEA